jgi:hypothetical protein
MNVGFNRQVVHDMTRCLIASSATSILRSGLPAEIDKGGQLGGMAVSLFILRGV